MLTLSIYANIFIEKDRQVSSIESILYLFTVLDTTNF